jgi:hypothetical protein
MAPLTLNDIRKNWHSGRLHWAENLVRSQVSETTSMQETPATQWGAMNEEGRKKEGKCYFYSLLQ